ncbi:hypothetical protein [Aestuariimicrobium ganziense]|uniref:hypothetical protein n=1 Tax=Aestuariimicrobium ganziense TaxID=2773677 RepID=UPI0019405B74|nr:hypothetical protein [Aestuariimicrobium ganziense]
MPTPPLSQRTLDEPLVWQGIALHPLGADLGPVLDQHSGLVLADRIGVEFDAPWQPVGPGTWRWGSATVSVEWLVEDDQWALLLDLRSTDDLTVPGPRLVVEGEWPTQHYRVDVRHCGLVLEPGRDDGSAVVLAAQPRVGDWGHPLDGIPINLRGSRITRRLTWTARWVRTPADLAGLLPAWYPPHTSGDPGSEIVLPLPAAGIDSRTLTVVQDEDAAVVTLLSGAHTIDVHQAATSSRVLVWGRADAVDHDEPAAGTALAVANALRAGDLEGAEQHLEEVLHRPGTVPPLVVALSANLLAASARPEHAALVEEALVRMSPEAGAVLAHARAWTALLVHGAQPSPPPPPPAPAAADHRPAPTCRRAELAVLSGADHPTGDVWRMWGLTGRGLPVETLDPDLVAPFLAVLEHAPEHWDLGDGSLLPMPAQVEAVRTRLLAEHPDHEASAWLW